MHALWPDRALSTQKINGTEIDLVPLVPANHAGPLLTLFSAKEKWAYLRDGPFYDILSYTAHLNEFQYRTAVAAYVIVEMRTGDILGKMCLLHAKPAAKSLEIGYCVFGDRIIGHPFGKQAIALLLDAVFNLFACELCEWRCDARNIASAKFATKFSFKQIEFIQNHIIVKGQQRDTIVFQLQRGTWETRQIQSAHTVNQYAQNTGL